MNYDTRLIQLSRIWISNTEWGCEMYSWRSGKKTERWQKRWMEKRDEIVSPNFDIYSLHHFSDRVQFEPRLVWRRDFIFESGSSLSLHKTRRSNSHRNRGTRTVAMFVYVVGGTRILRKRIEKKKSEIDRFSHHYQTLRERMKKKELEMEREEWERERKERIRMRISSQRETNSWVTSSSTLFLLISLLLLHLPLILIHVILSTGKK